LLRRQWDNHWLEYYAMLFDEITRMNSGAFHSLAEVDIKRILLR